MGVKIINLGSMVLFGAIIADALSHGEVTTNIINAFGNMWNQSVSTVAGK